MSEVPLFLPGRKDEMYACRVDVHLTPPCPDGTTKCTRKLIIVKSGFPPGNQAKRSEDGSYLRLIDLCSNQL